MLYTFTFKCKYINIIFMFNVIRKNIILQTIDKPIIKFRDIYNMFKLLIKLK